MRWVLAVGALSLVALTSPIAAGDKRSAALAVRVTVVRSCSVDTDRVGPSGVGTVNCGTRFGPPVLSASSTITVPMPIPPAPRVDTGPLPGQGYTPAPGDKEQPQANTTSPPVPRSDEARSDEAVLLSSPEDVESAAPAAAGGRAPAGGRGAGRGPLGTAADNQRITVAFRLVTVNF